MIIWGGTLSRDSSYPPDGWRYDPGADSWTAITAAGAPAGRALHTAVWTGSQMIVWGGEGLGGDSSGGGRYTLSTNTWSSMTTSGAPATRIQHSMVWTGTEAIVWGGFHDATGSTLGDGAVYDPVTNRWSGMASGTPFRLVATVWTGSKMILGIASGQAYDPVGDVWTPLSTDGTPPIATGGTTAVWTGAEMIVWGGSYSSPLNTGARYIPPP